ncbi:unnamed protein product [Durusdinium trenchii]|uniref:Uncharacterized protein n=1 Tax=Durusdinium trenchii TaxID=1381693 RepID=A0ABP0JEC0_9DINO
MAPGGAEYTLVPVSLVSGESVEIKLLPGSTALDLKDRFRKQWPSYKDVSLQLFLLNGVSPLQDSEQIDLTSAPSFLLVAGEAAPPPRTDELMATINQTCQDAGGIYAKYGCKAISWDDCTRSAGPKGLSCFGPNITDSRLVERSGKTLYTVRGSNWNERLGKVAAKDVTVLVTGKEKELKPISLREYLEQIHQYGGYAGVPADTALHADADQEISIRFQTTFLPVHEDGTVEFCGEAYNYQTVSNDDPKNLVLLCTSEGTFVQQQGVGFQKLFLHETTEASEQIARCWMEAKRTGHRVGEAQEESWEAAAESALKAQEAQRELEEAQALSEGSKDSAQAERVDQLKMQVAQLDAEATERKLRAAEAEEATLEGKAVARRFGIDAMGSRCNMLMTIQVPLEQKAPAKTFCSPTSPTFEGHVCGIDFGTTNCRVALWENGGAVVLPNALGDRSTPCCVAAKDGELLVGSAAKSSRVPGESLVVGPKRYLGRTYSELATIGSAPVQAGCNDEPYICLPCGPGGELKLCTPEEIATVLLKDVKKVVTDYLGDAKKQLGCVITVPAHATDAQRQATKSAAAAAGFEVMRIINEPAAASIAHGLDKMSDAERKVIVVDVGAGTTDVSLLEIDSGIFEILATNGAQLGGSDFDEALMATVKHQHQSRTPCELQEACEAVKRALSYNYQARIELDETDDSDTYESYKMSRAAFEELIRPTIQQVEELILATLRDGKVDVKEIDEVLLVGGSAKVPLLREMVTKLFQKEPCDTVHNCEDAVVIGAAYQAAILCGKNSAATDLLLLDVTPLSIGFESANGAMTRVIGRNTTIPTRKTVTLTTHMDWQQSVKLRIFEGERSACQVRNRGRSRSPLGGMAYGSVSIRML